MSNTTLTPRERELTNEIQRLRALLDEPMQTVEAIRRGEVDAFVVLEAEERERVLVLKSADRLYRMMVESMGEGAVTLSQDRVITYCNPHFVRLLGLPRNELLGRPLRDRVTEETRGAFDALLKNGGRADVELIAADDVIPATIASTILDDPDGSYYCLVINDLRDQRTREQLRAAKEDAEKANRAKDDFLAMVSHELRSPITVILGWTRMLQMNRVDRETTALGIENIHNSTARLLKLVEDILDASRLASGKMTLQREAFDLREAVHASIESVRMEVDQKPLRVTVRMSDERLLVDADPGRLQQVVVNLLANAIKFTPPHGRIDIDVQRIDGRAVLQVTDSGEGIDPSFLSHVFERFRQDDTSTTRAHKGLGLGLAIVKQLVEAHDGTVAAHSDGKGLGARFTVSLPITQEVPQHDAATPAQHEPLPSLDGVRVLLVDDEPETVEVMRTILGTAGAIVDSAMAVAHAIERAGTFSPHIIISDIVMPGEDGFQFIRQLDGEIPVLAITGKTSTSDRDEILAAGFRAYLAKPIEPAELIRAIAKLVR